MRLTSLCCFEKTINHSFRLRRFRPAKVDGSTVVTTTPSAQRCARPYVEAHRNKLRPFAPLRRRSYSPPGGGGSSGAARPRIPCVRSECRSSSSRAAGTGRHPTAEPCGDKNMYDTDDACRSRAWAVRVRQPAPTSSCCRDAASAATPGDPHWFLLHRPCRCNGPRRRAAESDRTAAGLSVIYSQAMVEEHGIVCRLEETRAADDDGNRATSRTDGEAEGPPAKRLTVAHVRSSDRIRRLHGRPNERFRHTSDAVLRPLDGVGRRERR